MPDENTDMGENNSAELLNNPDVQALIKSEVEKANTSLESNRNAILSEKKELEKQLKEANKIVDNFKDLDVEKVRTMMDAINKSEEAKLISEGKIDEVIAARTESIRNNFETQFGEKDSTIEALQAENQNIKQMYENKLIADAVQAEAIKQGMLPEAIVDAVNNSNGIFKLDESGSVIANKPDEFINSPERFIKSLKETKPYYWPSNADFKLEGSNSGGQATLGDRLSDAAQNSDFEQYKKLRAKQNS